MRILAAIVCACFGVGLASAGTGPTLIWLGNLNTDPGYAECHGVSNQGIVSGWAGVRIPHHVFRWTPGGNMQDLGSFGGPGAEGWGMSDDGQVVVGIAFLPGTPDIIGHAFRWENGVLEDLGTLGGEESWAYDASADGSVVVGTADLATGWNDAFRWTREGGMEDLGTLPGGPRAVARGVSSDGSVVVGWSDLNGQPWQHHAFRWENGVMTDIHNPAWGQTEALGVSGDGNVVVGAWGDADFTPARAFRWTAQTGMVDLGSFSASHWGEAWAANYDGSMVVGWSEVASGQWRAFLWTQADGMQDLNVLFADLLTDGSILWDAMAISPDGRYIAGHGIRPNGDDQAYLLDTTGSAIAGDLDGDGDVDLADLSLLLAEFGCTTGCTADIDGDGDVDLTDLSMLLNNFGT